MVDLAENLIPIALIGAGGIGKTSIALAVLHHDRIKQRFVNNRRFIRCDRFPASSAHLLRCLSSIIGAGVENPEDLDPLRASLSSREIVIVLDNAESILDPQGPDARRIYAVVEELSRFDNIWLCITSRISTIPPDCRRVDVPTLSVDAARDAFYGIYNSNDRSDLVNPILEELDFHPLSITLLATVGDQNKWDMGRLAREWDRQRTSVLQTQHSNSLVAAIELSLASPMFQGLGPDARALLEIVAFFPQGVDENNLKWLPSTISNGTDIFDKFCILSLAHRSNGFYTMLAPLRDYLSPKDPMASPLLCTIKDLYFARLSVDIRPEEPNLEESRWITSDDVNVEHLLDVFTMFDANSEGVWDACSNFMEHLFWHKKRLTILKPKIEGLPDDHRFKPVCLFWLARLFDSVGNWVERKRLLVCTLDLWRERGSDYEVARVLISLSDTNRIIGLHEEGIQQVREALGICEQLGDTVQQAYCLMILASLLGSDKQFDAAEEAIFRAIGLLPEEGNQFRVCQCHRALGEIYQSKDEIEKAIHHFGVALAIATPFGWNDGLFWAHYRLAHLLRDEGRFDDAQAHVEHAKSHAVNDKYNLGGAMEEQAWIWYKQRKFEEARTEVLRAADIFDKLGAAHRAERCRELPRFIERELNTASGQSGFNCELLRVLTLRSKLREASDGIDGCVKFFKFILLQIARTLYLHLPFPCMAAFSFNNAPPSSCLFHSRTFILFLVLPFVVESLPESFVMYQPRYRMMPLIYAAV